MDKGAFEIPNEPARPLVQSFSNASSILRSVEEVVSRKLDGLPALKVLRQERHRLVQRRRLRLGRRLQLAEQAPEFAAGEEQQQLAAILVRDFVDVAQVDEGVDVGLPRVSQLERVHRHVCHRLVRVEFRNVVTHRDER